MDELNHRVRNTLAIVMAIANQTLRHASSAAQFRSDFEARVTALSAAHNLLTESNWEGASLRDIVESVLKPYGDPDAGALRARRRSDPGRPEIRGVAADGVPRACHQRREIRRAVERQRPCRGDMGADASRRKAPALAIEWREIGGPQVKPRRRRGFGSRLIDGLSAETNGNVDLKFERDGVVCSIEVPLPPDGEGISRTP